MAGHGGNRSGAGRKPGGLSQTRRMLLKAINQGLTKAGRAKGLTGSDEEIAAESAAHIVSDMIQAGQGADVLKLAAVSAPATDQGEGNGSKSPLLQALERLPGMQTGSKPAQALPEQSSDPINTGKTEQSATHTQSEAPDNQPFFTLQSRLLLNSPGRSGTPYPPLGGSPHPIVLDAEPFEKNSEQKSQASESAIGGEG